MPSRLTLPSSLLSDASSLEFSAAVEPYTTVVPTVPVVEPPEPLRQPQAAPSSSQDFELPPLDEFLAPFRDASEAVTGAVQQGAQRARSFGEQVLGTVDDWIPASWKPEPPPQTASGLQSGFTQPAGGGFSAMPTGAPAPGGDLRAYTRAKAASLGIDPDIAERVAMSEGGFNDPVRQSDVIYQGRREQSYGPFQLNVEGGLGSAALRQGIDPRDPAQVYRGIDFALENAAQGGWGPFHGAARVGIGNRQGIGNAPMNARTPLPGQPAAGFARPAAGALDVNSIVGAYQGKPYVFGGPGGRSDSRLGVPTDCSGFVSAVWKNQYGLDLPAHTDTAYNRLRGSGAPEVSQKDAQPGDVVFYMGAGTGGAITHHMGIYAGPGKVLDMSTSGGGGARVRDIGHAGQFVILRDPRVSQAPSRTASVPPPIVPTGVAEETGGRKLPQSEINVVSEQPATEPLLMRAPTGYATDVPIAQAEPPSDPDQGPREAGYTLPAPDPDQGPREAIPGSVGASNLGPSQASAEEEAGYASQQPVPVVIEDARTAPPAGLPYNPRQQSGLMPVQPRLTAPPVAEEPPPAEQPWRGAPLQTGAGPVGPGQPQLPQNDADYAVSQALGQGPPGLRELGAAPMPSMPTSTRVPSMPPRPFEEAAPFQDDVGAADIRAPQGQGVPPEPLGPAQQAVSDVGRSRFLNEPAAAQAVDIYNAISELPFEVYARARRELISDYEAKGMAGTDPLAPLRPLAAQYGVTLPDARTINPQGRPASDVFGALLLVGALPDPLDPVVQTALVSAGKTLGLTARGIRAGVRAATPVVEGAGRRIGQEIAENATRVAAADARAASQGSTMAPGVFGISGLTPDTPAVRGMRPRVIPPHVADELDFQIRVPDDPATIRAIEAAGGSVDPSKGVDLNVITYRDPNAAGQTATRGMVFYTAGPPGSPSPYATDINNPNAVGGTQRIEGWTRFRSPLILPDAPGEMRGFNGAMEQLFDTQGIQEARAEVARLNALLKETPVGPENDRIYMESVRALNRARELRKAMPTSADIDAGIRQARKAGPEGSPARSQALKDLVARYGGDPDLIDDLLAVRGADADESAWAIKENIVAANARQQGYDGVVTVMPARTVAAHAGIDEAVEAHPAVQAAVKAVSDAAEAYRASPTPEAAQRLRVATAESKATRERVFKELQPHEITELADVREAANPTPGAIPQAVLDAQKAEKAAFDRWMSLPEAQRPAAMEVWKAARDRLDAAITTEGNATPPGYTLRSDIPRRAPVRESTIVENTRYDDARAALRNANIAEQAARASGDPVALEAARAESQRAFAELEAAVRALEAGTEPRFTTAQATPGMSAARGAGVGSQILTDVSNSLGAGVFGAAAGAASDPENPVEAGLRGAGLGMVAGPLAGRLLRPGGGALATPGVRPGQGLPSGVITAYREAAERNAREMAAKGIAPPSATQWVRNAGGTISNSALLGPSTAAVNFATGSYEALRSIPKELIRSGVRAAQTRNPMAMREAFTAGHGALYGMTKVGEAVMDVIRNRGRYAPNPENPSLSQMTADPFLRAVASALETPGRLWSGLPDAIHGTIQQHATEFMRAAQLATDAGKRGKDWEDWVNLYLSEANRVRSTGAPSHQIGAGTADVLASGERAAERAGFREPLGEIGKKVRNFAKLGNVPVLGTITTPYFNAPWNAMLRTGENLPTGAMIGRSGERARPAFDRYFDAITGTAVVAGMGHYAMQGGVTGSGPSDPQQRQALMDEGWRPYSTLVGDYYVPNRAFGPFEAVLNAAGDYHDSFKYRKPDANERTIGEDALARIGKNIKQMPYAAGLASIIDLIEYGPASAVSDLAMRATPGAATLRAIGTSQDPIERTTDRGKDVPFWEEVGQRYQLGTGQREGLPPALTVLGQPRPNTQQGIGAVLPRVGVRQEDPVISAYQEIGTVPGRPPDEVDGVPLTPAQQRAYQETMGRELQRLVGPLVRGPGWQSMPPGIKKELLEDFGRVARELAAIRVRSEGGSAFIRASVDAEIKKATGR